MSRRFFRFTVAAVAVVSTAVIVAMPLAAAETATSTPPITIPATATILRGSVVPLEATISREANAPSHLSQAAGSPEERTPDVASSRVIYKSVGGPTYVASSYFPWHVLDDGSFPPGTAPVRIDSLLSFAFAPYWIFPESLYVDVVFWDGVTRAGPQCNSRPVYAMRLNFGVVQPVQFGDALVAAPTALPNPPTLYDDSWGIEFRFLQSARGTPSTLTTIVFAGNAATGSQPAIGSNENVFWLDANENGTFECDGESAAFSDPATQPSQFYLKLAGSNPAPTPVKPRAGWYAATSGTSSFRVHLAPGSAAVIDSVQYSARLNTQSATPPCSPAIVAYTDNHANVAVDPNHCFQHTGAAASHVSLHGCFISDRVLLAKMHYIHSTVTPPCIDETWSLSLIQGSATDVGETARTLPMLSVRQNTPNPFAPSTTIEFRTGGEAPVQVVVYDVAGRRVAGLVNAVLPPGWHAAMWNGEDEAGKAVASGVYFYRVTAGSEQETRRMLLFR